MLLCDSSCFFCKKPFLNNFAKVAETLRMKINIDILGGLVVANSIQVKRLEVNEKSILVNKTKVAKREASPGVSPAKKSYQIQKRVQFYHGI